MPKDDKKNALVEAEIVPQDNQQAIQVVTPMDLIQQAQERGSSIEQMQQLFDLQLRYEENEAKKAYHRAVAAFKVESINIGKDKQVGYKNKDGSFTGYTHASIGNVVSTIIPFLAKHGLSHRWDTKQEGANISVTCTLSHELGFSEQTMLVANKDDSGKKNAIQQVASTVTYLQRYTLLAITGLAAQDQDDDGQKSEEVIIEYINEDQMSSIDALVIETGANLEAFLGVLSLKGKVLVETIPQIPANLFSLAIKMLEAKRGK